MVKSDWLSSTEIAQLWSDETGESAEVLERDLDAWFLEFIEREPSQQLGSAGRDGDTTNRLMGMLGARYLERATFETYCEERGYPKPCFWSGVRDDDTLREKPTQSESAQSSPDATSPQSSEEPSVGRCTSDPELAAFQAQIASLSERLEADRIETTTLRKRSVADQQNHQTDRESAGISAGPHQEELIERAAAASAEASDLRVKIKAVEQQIAELSAKKEANRISSVARPAAPGPDAPSHDPVTGLGPQPRGSATYSDPRATSQLLRNATGSGKSRSRGALVAGFATLLVALFLWGGLTVIQLASNKPIPPPTLVTPAKQIQPEMAPQSLEPVTGKLGIGGEDLQQPDVAWASGNLDPMAAELTEARQRHETARQDAATEADSSKQRLILAAEIANAQAAISKQDLNATLERLARSKSETQTANARAAILARELVDIRLRHSAAVEIAATDAEMTHRQLVLEAQSASNKSASLEQNLDAAQQRIADLKAELSAARAEAAGLAEQLAKVRKAHAAAPEKARAEAETTRQELLPAAEAAATKAVLLDSALDRIAGLEATLQSLNVTAGRPAKELEQGR